MIFDEPSYQDELDELMEHDRMNMVLVEDLIPVWVVVRTADLFTSDEIEKLWALTDESLKLYWGSNAFVELDWEGGYIRLRHKDGRNFERFIAF